MWQREHVICIRRGITSRIRRSGKTHEMIVDVATDIAVLAPINNHLYMMPRFAAGAFYAPIIWSLVIAQVLGRYSPIVKLGLRTCEIVRPEIVLSKIETVLEPEALHIASVEEAEFKEESLTIDSIVEVIVEAVEDFGADTVRTPESPRIYLICTGQSDLLVKGRITMITTVP